MKLQYVNRTCNFLLKSNNFFLIFSGNIHLKDLILFVDINKIYKIGNILFWLYIGYILFTTGGFELGVSDWSFTEFTMLRFFFCLICLYSSVWDKRWSFCIVGKSPAIWQVLPKLLFNGTGLTIIRDDFSGSSKLRLYQHMDDLS